MKNSIFICFVCFVGNLFAQDVIPFVDFNNWFKTYSDNQLQYIEMQPIKEYKAGDNLVAYINFRGNLQVYDGIEKQELSNMNLDFKISDNLLVWNVGTTLNMWDDGNKKTLSFFGGNYVVKDNLIVYEDTRYNTLQVYWNGREYPIQTSTSELVIQDGGKIGENIMAYADNGNLYRIFYKGQTYEVGVWYKDINFQAGTDIIAFNDPTTRTFAVFENGEIMDVEMQWVDNYKAGRGFVAYTDANNNLQVYQDGKRTMLSSFPGRWAVRDDMLLYQKNGFTYVYYENEEILAANYVIDEYKIKNGVLVFRNLQGGVDAVVQGERYELTNLQKAEFDIYGNAVLLSLFNNSHLILKDGKVIKD